MRLPVTHVAEWNGLKVCRGAGRKKEEVVRQWSVGWSEGSRKGDGGRVGKEMVTDRKAGWLHYRARTSVVSSQRTTVQPLWPVQKGKKTDRAVVSFWVKVSEQTSQLHRWASANSADCLTKQSAKEQEWPGDRNLTRYHYHTAVWLCIWIIVNILNGGVRGEQHHWGQKEATRHT